MKEIKDEEEFQEWKTLNHEKYLLTFGATWCKNCNKLSPLLAALGDEHSIPIIKIDVDNLPNLAEDYNVSTLPHTIFFSNNQVIGSYIGSDIQILSENMMLFLSNTLSNDNSSTKPSGIDLPIPVIHEVIDESRFPKVHDDNITKEDLSQLLFNKIEFTPIPASQESEQIINLAFSDASIPSSPVDRCVGEHALSNLFIFKVPRLNPEGTCSNLHDLSDRPYNLAVDAYGISEDALAAFLSNRSHPLIIRTSRLNRAVNLLYLLTTADWIGIYRVVDADSELGLLKEAYLGEPSRAVFPLTEAFSLKSTNSWVGLNGQIRHIPNTRARAEGVSYYECSGSVQSEICVPILRSFPTQTGSEWRVIGIIDLESWKPNHFTPQMIRDVLEVGFHLGGCDEFFKLPKY